MLVQVYTSVGRHKLSLGRKLFKNDPCKQSRRQKDLRGGRENTTSTLQHQQSTVLQLGGLLLYFHGGTINSTAAVKQWCKHMYLHAHLVSHFEKQVLTIPAAGWQVPRREGSPGEWQWL